VISIIEIYYAVGVDTMPITSTISDDGSEVTIKVDGRFNFNCHEKFRNTYEATGNKPNGYIVDLGNTTYMDSSAMGMLLILREYAKLFNATTSIINCNRHIITRLTVANFEELFDIKQIPLN
jgi:HptB-dependent secretion and biofilm anti anti-sigma factor